TGSAIDEYARAIGMYETQRSAIPDSRRRAAFTESHRDLYERATMLMFDQRRYAEALDLLERWRSRLTTDFLAARQLLPAKPADREIFSRLTAAESRLHAAQSSEWRKNQLDAVELKKARAAYADAFARATESIPELLAPDQSQPVTLAALQQV